MSRRAAPRRRGIRSSSWFRTTRSSISRRIARSRGPAGSATTAAPGSWLTAVWPCCPRAQRWASPTRRSGDAVVRAARERRLVQGGGSLTALRAARAMGASTIRTKTGAAGVCGAWRELELLPPRNGPRGRTPIRVRGVRVWNDRLEWLLLTTRPVESLEQALEIVSWYTRRWIVEEFHKAWKTGCRAEERRLTQADRLVPLLGALAIVAVRLLTLRDAARHDSTAPADAPAAALKVLAAKLQRPAECFESN